MRPGDVVIAVGDKPIANTPQLLNAVAALKPRRRRARSRVQRGDKRARREP